MPKDIQEHTKSADDVEDLSNDQQLYNAPNRTPDGDNGKKKKTIIGIVVGIIVVVAIILIIVLATGKSHHHNPDGPVIPPAFEHYNPYKVEGKVTFTESGYTG